MLDWEHMESRGFLSDRLVLRAMTSLGALGNRDGTPSLLQTGGTYEHGYIHDRQHANDFLMEAAADLRLPVTSALSGHAYFALVGSPALGPPSYMHRPSAAADPIAPIGHHWQDATHASYGVVTGGVTLSRVRLEASAFNARESDYEKPWPDFSHGRLDSFSARVGFDTQRLAISGWWGYLKDHDPIATGMQMHRYGASIAANLSGLGGGTWSSLAVWGMNAHHHDGSSHLLLHGDPNASPHVRSSSLLLESNLEIGSRDAVFGRLERVMKNGEELGFLGGDLMQLYEIRSAAIGARRDVAMVRAITISLSGRIAASFLPSTLELSYGTRRPLGLDVFAQLRGGH